MRITSLEQRTNRLVGTDSNGHFDVSDLPAGRYRLYVSKAGYVTLEYGQARPFEAGKPIDLGTGQVLDRVDFRLPRGSVIAGRITDEYGDPLADVQVMAMRFQFVSGERRLVDAGRPAMTDDVGHFRIFGLMPGAYLVRAAIRGGAPAVIDATIDAATGYPVTYYPGTTDPAQAQLVTVSLGQELGSVAFALSPARMSRVSGVVVTSLGTPLQGGLIFVRSETAAASGLVMHLAGSHPVRADGTFTINNLAPGEYILDVQQRPRPMRGGGRGGTGQPPFEFASVPLAVGGDDITGLVIATSPGASVRGRIVVQAAPGTKAQLQGVQVLVSGASGSRLMARGAGGRVRSDGTFELLGLSGAQLVRVSGIPPNLALRSIVVDGADITDRPHDFRGASETSEMVVTLTDRVSEIAGTVSGAKGQAVTDYVIVVFPEDASLWRAQSRLIATARPNQTGVFSLKGLPPGRYLAVAAVSVENGAQYSPEFLDRLRSAAHTVPLADGQQVTLTLRLSGDQP